MTQTHSNRSLIERQELLLKQLTSPEFIFGTGFEKFTPDPSRRGIDPGRLRLEAELTFDKRVGKIEKAMRKTFALLGHDRPRVLKGFAAAHPPRSYRRYDEAREFCDYLRANCQTFDALPPFILDVATVELALARFHAASSAGEAGTQTGEVPEPSNLPAVRIHPRAQLLHLNYDLSSVLSGSTVKFAPPARNCTIVVFEARQSSSPRAVEVPDHSVEFLKRVSIWTPLENDLRGAQHPSPDLIDQLVNLNILEVAA